MPPTKRARVKRRVNKPLCAGDRCKDRTEDLHWHGQPMLGDLLVPVESLTTYHRNPRRGDVDTIAASLRRFGQYRAIGVNAGTFTDRPDEVLAGNHTLTAARANTWTHIARTVIDVDDEDAQRIVVADNGTADLGTYDTASLLEHLVAMADNLEGLGYTEGDIEQLTAELASIAPEGSEEDGGRALTTGERLALVDVSVGEPAHVVTHGQTWEVGDHLLVVARVSDEHHLWSEHLATEGVVFCPYPEPYLTLGAVADEHRLLLVQPNLFLAGHLLDKHASIFGEASVVLRGVDA